MDSGGGASDGGGGPADGGDAPRDGGFVAVGEVLLSATTVDLGKVVVNTTGEARLTITNPQSNPVQVSLSTPAGPDADAFTIGIDVPREGNTFTLDPGAVATVSISMTPSEARDHLATLALDSCQGTCPASIVLIGEGVLTGVVCPEQVDVGVVNPETCITASVTCDNQGNATEQIAEAALEESSDPSLAATAPALPASLDPGDTFDVEVTFCPTALGAVTGSLVVRTDMPSDVTHTIDLSARGGGPDVLCGPASIDFGPAGLGGDQRATVRCDNRGDEDAQIMGSLTAGADFSLVASPASPLPAGTGEVFEIRFSPASLGQKQDVLQIVTNDPDTPTFDVALSGEGVDLLPCDVIAQPAALDFGLVAVGDRRSAAITVRNQGVTDCLVSGFSTTASPNGPFSVTLPATPPTLAPGATVQVPVQFSPIAPGTVTASVTVAFANPGSVDLGISVSGQGGNPELQVEPYPIDFGSVAVGCATPETISVTIRRIAPGFGAVTNVQLVNASTTAFTLSVGPLPQNLGFFDSIQADITFSPDVVGPFSGELRVSGSASGPIVVPVTGNGQPTSQRTDTKSLTRPPVDVLFVVDDSCSMGAAQAALGQAMPAFVNAFSSRGVDFQFGVVTTDMNDQTKSGRLQGMPTYVTSMTPNLLDTLSARMQPGTGGSGIEQGIRAAVSAVTSPLSITSNSGFLRANADLAVIWLTDENDGSQGGFTIQDYLAALRAAAGSGDLTLTGMTGPANGNCTGPYGPGQAGSRYHQLIGSTLNGLTLSFCDDMQSNLLQVSGRIFGDETVPLSATPVINTLEVAVNGTVVPRLSASGGVNWAYELATNSVYFLDVTVVPQGATITVTYDAFCLSGTCGDSTTDPNEQCDDGNMANDDACINCVSAVCGDGFVQNNVETCDDGNIVETDACPSTCLTASCGDGFLHAGVEGCDDGNTVDGDGCPADCVAYVVSAPTANMFTPIANGTNLTFAGGQNPNNDGVAQIVLPFGFTFFGVPSSTVSVSVNGLLAMGAISPAQSGLNTGIPNANPPNGIIAAWWEDLILDTAINGGAAISWAVQGTAPNRVAVIQWRDVRVADHSTTSHRRFTFQIRLEETANIIRLVYGDTETSRGPPTATSASAGIEGPLGLGGYEALGCSPTCSGPPRPGRPTGFPQQSMVTITPR